jgi:hypothetical protein
MKTIALAAGLLLICGAANADLVGTVYEGDPPGLSEVWEYRQGGVIVDPIWYSDYERKDGTHFILINWALPRKRDAKQAVWQITDALVISSVPKDQTIEFTCKQKILNVFEYLFAQVRAEWKKEWWRDIRRVWKIDHYSGTITSASPKDATACQNQAGGTG